jgi:hypothetical protein
MRRIVKKISFPPAIQFYCPMYCSRLNVVAKNNLASLNFCSRRRNVLDEKRIFKRMIINKILTATTILTAEFINYWFPSKFHWRKSMAWTLGHPQIGITLVVMQKKNQYQKYEKHYCNLILFAVFSSCKSKWNELCHHYNEIYSLIYNEISKWYQSFKKIQKTFRKYEKMMKELKGLKHTLNYQTNTKEISLRQKPL